MGAKLRANQSERTTWNLERFWADVPGNQPTIVEGLAGGSDDLPCHLHKFPHGVGVLGGTLRATMRCEKG